MSSLSNMVAREIHSYADTLRPVPRTSDSLFVCCPFHEERTPSCRINLHSRSYPIGAFICYGCGETGNWNKLAEKVGMRKMERHTDNGEEKAYRRKTKEKEMLNMGMEEEATFSDIVNRSWGISYMMQPPTDWRDMSKELLRSVGAKFFLDTRGGREEPFLVFPVMVWGSCVGAIKARWQKVSGKNSYFNSKGSWSSTHGLFLFDHARKIMREHKHDFVVVVEGPRDALRLSELNMPTVASLGTGSWSDEKVDLLLSLPIKQIIVCQDGDVAGRKANLAIKERLAPLINTKIFSLAKQSEILYGENRELDPCSAPTEILMKIFDRAKS